MLKFSGYPYLIRGQTVGKNCWRAPLRPQSEYFCYAQGLTGTADGLRAGPRTAPKTKLGLIVFNDARTGMAPGVPRGAMCVQRFDDSLNSAIHITYRISLRSSSMPEPRDPLLKVLVNSQSAQTLKVARVSRGPLAGALQARPGGGCTRRPAKATLQVNTGWEQRHGGLGTR